LATACVGLALFAAAEGEAWLFAARAAQGLAVGMISGAATAALVELDPHGSRRRAALGAGLAQAGGSALGPLVAGVLVQWAPDPLRLSYLVTLGATAAAATLVLRVPERRKGGPEPWRRSGRPASTSAWRPSSSRVVSSARSSLSTSRLRRLDQR